MICPECGAENQDSAKFCKQCGTSLNPVATMKKTNSDESRPIKSGIFNENDSSPSSFEAKGSGGDNKNLIIICLTVIICAVLIAGGLIFLSNGSDNGNDSTDVGNSISLPDSSVNQTEDTQNQNDNTPSSDSQKSSVSNMKIEGGSFSTGSSLDDKTWCSVYVGEQYAGENVKISVLYSRDGSNLNQGKIVPKTVDSDGTVSVASADAFKYYPDHALVTIYDNNGNVLDTQEVIMSAKSGTQTF